MLEFLGDVLFQDRIPVFTEQPEARLRKQVAGRSTIVPEPDFPFLS